MLKRGACNLVKMKINKYKLKKVSMIAMKCMTLMKEVMFSKVTMLSRTALPSFKIQIPKTQSHTIYKATKKTFTII